jgi:hypothetical protein
LDVAVPLLLGLSGYTKGRFKVKIGSLGLWVSYLGVY